MTKYTNGDDMDHEDAETLAAIDERLRDIEASRVVPAEKVRELVKKWTSAAEKRNQNRPRGRG